MTVTKEQLGDSELMKDTVVLLAAKVEVLENEIKGLKMQLGRVSKKNKE